VLRDEYVARFNEGVRTGTWSGMLELLDDDADLEFVGIPSGHSVGARRSGRRSREPERPAGELQLEERDGRIRTIRVLYEFTS